MGELRDIVGAMRSLAGLRMQEAQRALPGVRRYSASTAAAVGAALRLIAQPVPEPPRSGRRALILCLAEHGFVGAFNDRLLQGAEAVMPAADPLLVLGSRGAGLACEGGRKVSWSHPMATRLAGVPDTVNHLSGELYRRLAPGEIVSVEVMFSRYRPGATGSIERQRLLPPDTAALAAAPAAEAPLHNLEPTQLFEKLLSEYVFARLTEAAAESIVSENAARFAAMESAHDNVTKKLTELQQGAQQERQSDITAELLDLMIGAGALSGTPGSWSLRLGR